MSQCQCQSPVPSTQYPVPSPQLQSLAHVHATDASEAANQKLLLFSATIFKRQSSITLAPSAGAAAASCHVMEMSACSSLRFHKRVDLQPFNTSDDPEHGSDNHNDNDNKHSAQLFATSHGADDN